MAKPQSLTRATSMGYELSDAAHLDAHFAAAQPEYEAMLRSTNLQPGWHVLDAGCGNGCFLPLIAKLVGPSGRITAIDLAPEHIATVNTLITHNTFPCPAEARISSVVKLPFANQTFDAVWCANVTMYLTEEELAAALAEFRRVVCPGGIVAVKEYDATVWQFHPADPILVWRFFEAARRHHGQMALGTLRAVELPMRFRRAGLVDIQSKTTLTERRPSSLAERQGWGGVIKFYSELAQRAGVSQEDLEHWRKLGDVDAPDHISQHPDFYVREGHNVVVGHVL
jgi:arsenite methyltransferase